MSSQPEYPDNELATFTSEGHDDFMRRIEEADNSEPASAIKAPKKRTRRRKPTKQDMAKAVHFEQEQEFLGSFASKEEDNESVKSEREVYPDRLPDSVHQSEPAWNIHTQPRPDIFTYFSDPNPFRQGIYQPNAFSRDVDQESSRASVRSDNTKPKITPKNEDDAKIKRKLIHQIYRYRDKFNLKLKKPPSEKMTIGELEDMKSSLRNQITEKEGARIVKTLYIHGLTGIDNISQVMGYKEMRGLGRVADAVANDEENELLWEELAIEFEDYLHVSPQRKLVMLTAQILLTTYKINTDEQYRAFMSQQAQQDETDLRREYESS
jgi:hypothetical protein